MKNGHRNLIGIVCAYSVALVCGLGGYAPQAGAQTAQSLAAGRSNGAGVSTVHGTDGADRKLQKQVAAALDDEHINVSVEGGVVVLSGRVFDDWDMRKALRTARRASGASPVVDSLSIEQGGR